VRDLAGSTDVSTTLRHVDESRSGEICGVVSKLAESLFQWKGLNLERTVALLQENLNLALRVV